MRRAEQIELALIPGLSLMAGWGSTLLPERLSVGRLLVLFSAVLLLQSLVRDLSILMRKQAAPDAPRHVRCFCVESTLGAAGIVMGLALSGSLLGTMFTLTPLLITVSVLVTGVVGFLIRDLVITWWPLRIRRDPDHRNIIVRW